MQGGMNAVALFPVLAFTAGFSSTSPRPRSHVAPAVHLRASGMMMRLEPMECSEANVEIALDEFRKAAKEMIGIHERAASIGITGDISVADVDGPFVTLQLSGKFWHKRETVMRNAAAWLQQRIPELADVSPADERTLLDVEMDEETGAVLIDWRAPDYNGDRETLEYQGIDPDSRGPFGGGAGGLRAGGSMFS